MSGWPWMKDVQLQNPIDSSGALVSEPIDIEGYDDHRPAIKDLLQENRELIDELKKQLSSTSSSSPDENEKNEKEGNGQKSKNLQWGGHDVMVF